MDFKSASGYNVLTYIVYNLGMKYINKSVAKEVQRNFQNMDIQHNYQEKEKF